MRFALLAVSLALGLGACEREAAVEAPSFLFDSRVPLDPQLEKLKEAGDDPNKGIKPTSAADLAKLLEPGKRYLHVVMPNGTLVIAPRSVDAPGHAWSHPVLANGGAVKAAGHLRVDVSSGALAKVTVDAESDTYCPLPESLRATLGVLAALKVPNDLVRVESRAADCWKPKEKPAASASAKATVNFGSLMVGVAHRFEILGRAYKAKKLDLATYELEELEEAFRDDLPVTPLPPLPPGVTIAPFAATMTQKLIPGLRKALESKDDKAIVDAFETTAKTCNACHSTAGRAFIQVPTTPGEPVPMIEASAGKQVAK